MKKTNHILRTELFMVVTNFTSASGQHHGVQHRIVLVVHFFIFLKLLCSLLLL